MNKVKNVFVLSTAVLSFISFWRASAIVLCDFGSSAFYAGGIAAKAYGQAFAYFIIAVMLLAGLLLMSYIESSSLFTRGGVYVVVNKSMGKTMAKLSVSALVFDYLLTAPISSVSAGLYLSYLINSLLSYFKIGISFNPRTLAVIFSIASIFYFARQNIKGVKESSQHNLRIIVFAAVVGFLLFILSIFTIIKKGFVLPPFKLNFSEESLGWARYIDFLKPVGLVGVIMALGHSILALSGLETLAQVYREIEDPKIKNIKKTVLVLFIFSFLFTGMLTFFSALIIPFEKIINEYYENLLSGLAMELFIPYHAKIIMSILVVISAFLMLFGAVNTAIVGANGILNRVAEDGILPQSIRRLHPRYGTTYIIITSIAALQALIVLLSGGDIFILGEAYAFGVLWSITFNIASLILLRFKQDNLEREWYYPLNIKWRRYKLPIGLFLLFIIMFSLSLINLFTKKLATIFGLSFTLILYIVFTYFERKQTTCSTDIHKLNEDDIDEKVNINAFNDVELVFKNFNKEKRILVPVRNPNNLVHLKWVLENFSDEETDIAVLYVRFEKGYDYSAGNENMNYEEKELFKKVILLAEKYGKKIHPLIVSSNEPFYVIIYSALVGVFQMIVMGVSGTTGAEIQMENIALWWGTLRPKDFKSSIEVRIIWDGRTLTYNLT